ncbi:MAG: septal ring lytic transglycosylase RlpA family protein [Rhizobiaceae bacterium]
MTGLAFSRGAGGRAATGGDRFHAPKILTAILAAGLLLSGCNTSARKSVVIDRAEINTETKFSSAEYGVQGSPRVTVSKTVPKGGGRYQVGKPYKIKGKWYKPVEDPGYQSTGMASWYGPNFHGRLTANGEIYDQYSLSAAHPTMPLPSYARVTNLENGASVMVRVNDRGPYAHGRLIDLSARAAELLDYQRKGVAKVKVEYVGKARLDGKDDKFLLASYRAPGMPAFEPGATQPGTMIAMAPEQSIPAPAEAIGTSLDGSFALAQIPIPVERPLTQATYEGLPMEMGTPILTASLQPLGYLATSPSSRLLQAFASVDQSQAARLFMPEVDPQGDASLGVTIRLGLFGSSEAAQLAAAAFPDLGLMSIHQDDSMPGKWAADLLAAGDVAQSLLDILHSRGMRDAHKL